MYVCTYVQVYTHVVYVHVEARCLPRVLFSLCFLRQAPIGAGTCQLGWIPGQQALGPSCLGYPPPPSRMSSQLALELENQALALSLNPPPHGLFHRLQSEFVKPLGPGVSL